MRFRHLIVLLAVVLGCGLTGHTARAQRVIAALKVGGATTTLRGNANVPFDYKTSLMGGAGVGYDFGNGFYTEVEALYVIKGATSHITRGDLYDLGIVREVPDDPASPASLTFNLTYVDVPVLLGYRLDTRRRLKPIIFAGPSFGFKAEAQVEFFDEKTGQGFTESDDTVESFDLGVAFGGGVLVDLYSEQLFFTVRGSIGTSNTRDANPPLRNTGIIFMTGLTF